MLAAQNLHLILIEPKLLYVAGVSELNGMTYITGEYNI